MKWLNYYWLAAFEALTVFYERRKSHTSVLTHVARFKTNERAVTQPEQRTALTASEKDIIARFHCEDLNPHRDRPRWASKNVLLFD